MDKYKILVIVLIVFVILLIVVLSSKSRIFTVYEKYMHIDNQSNLSGKQLAILAKRLLGLNDLQLALTKQKLGDAYSPKYKALILSEDVCNTASLSSMAIVSHELGHAMQDNEGGFLFIFNRFLRLITNLTNRLILPLIIIGIFFYVFQYPTFSTGSILLVIAGSLFILNLISNLFTIPVEYDASSRALKFLKQYNLLSGSEIRKAKKLLGIAAQTYIAGLLDGIVFIKIHKKIKQK